MSTESMPAPRAALSDRDLVARFREPGSDAYAVLYGRHARVVYAYAARLLNVTGDIEDVVQDTFVLAWNKLDPRRLAGDSALPWLLSTTRYLSFNANRARVRLRALEQESTEPLSPDNAERHVLALEQSAQIAAALSVLSELDRRIVQLCLGSELTYKEAAQRVGVSSASVRNRLSRARRTLKTELRVLKGEGQ